MFMMWTSSHEQEIALGKLLPKGIAEWPQENKETISLQHKGSDTTNTVDHL